MWRMVAANGRKQRLRTAAANANVPAADGSSGQSCRGEFRWSAAMDYTHALTVRTIQFHRVLNFAQLSLTDSAHSPELHLKSFCLTKHIYGFTD
jgi:hypothetical protein